MHHRTRWTAQRIRRRLEYLATLVYRQTQELPAFRYLELDGPETPPPLEEDTSTWALVPPRSYWGKWRVNFILRCEFEMPAWGEALVFPIGETGDFSHPEALVYVDGKPIAGTDKHHPEVRVDLKPGNHRLALHGWTGLGGNVKQDLNRRLYMSPCLVVQVDQPLREFLAAARCALGLGECLDEKNPAHGRVLNALEEAFQALDTREGVRPECAPALKALRDGLGLAGPSLDADLWATGHAHLDVAWLWTYGQTRQKAARTFHTALLLMEQFPDYHFSQSQPVLYEWVRQDHPELFARIQQRVKQGRWEPTGGMWVEADANLSGGEALVRQFLLGRRFFQEHFGDRATPVLWLPDVFGYPASLPQILRGAGMEYFFTIKIGWSQYNRLPFDSFWWEGLDGTRVLTSFSTTPCNPGEGEGSTYNALAEPRQILGSWNNLLQKEHQRDLLMSYGHGDGGGGPTREMLENLHQVYPAAPRIRLGPAYEFFRNLERNSGARLPTWNGELYLELHRGTYTTQSRTKRANRKLEVALHDAEAMSLLAGLPAELRRAWEILCLNQFHDVLPGSSVGEVYVDAEKLYAEGNERAQLALARAAEALGEQMGGELLLVNTTSFARNDLAYQPGWTGRYPEGMLSQQGPEGIWIACKLEAYTAQSVSLTDVPSPALETGLKAEPQLLENPYVRLELNDDGDIVRIFDKINQREVLAKGGLGNQFQAFEDRPLNWDAWDIDIFYDDKVWHSEPASRVRVLEQGPLVATLEVERKILSSPYRQRIRLYYNSARIDFETWIDWRERHVLLKTAFPVDVRSQRATYEIQWGAVERLTHRNTSWDWARFEVCAHKWVDLSEADYGVSLLNDCKYGHDIRDNVMRLSLLRSPTSPDREADQGEHRFTYSLLPHRDRWGTSTISQAYFLNYPVLVLPVQAGARRSETSHLVHTDVPWAVVETVKPAEDGRGFIVRVYESQQRRGRVRLAAGFPLRGAYVTNLVEEDGEALEVHGHFVEFTLRPFQIATFRLIR